MKFINTKRIVHKNDSTQPIWIYPRNSDDWLEKRKHKYDSPP